MKSYRDIWSGTCIIAFAVLLYAATFSVRDFTASSIGADFLPRLAAMILVGLGAALIVDTVRRNKALGPAASAAPNAKTPASLRGPLLVVANILLFCIYLFFLEDIGFLITTALYLFAQMWLLTAPGKRKPALFAVVSVATAATSYYLFVLVFQVMLPEGILG